MTRNHILQYEHIAPTNFLIRAWNMDANRIAYIGLQEVHYVRFVGGNMDGNSMVVLRGEIA